jgi:hypothetical protein
MHILGIPLDLECILRVSDFILLFITCLFRTTFKGFIIASSNAWGLFLIIIFLGYGLVTIPKHCFH